MASVIDSDVSPRFSRHYVLYACVHTLKHLVDAESVQTLRPHPNALWRAANGYLLCNAPRILPVLFRIPANNHLQCQRR